MEISRFYDLGVIVYLHMRFFPQDKENQDISF